MHIIDGILVKFLLTRVYLSKVNNEVMTVAVLAIASQ